MSEFLAAGSNIADHRPSYDCFARLFDRFMAEDFCRAAFPAMEGLLFESVPRGSRILDLCCGSGQLARELSKRGYRVLGADASRAMLALARRNAPEASFIAIDVRRLKLPPIFQAAICTFNSLAHMRTREEIRDTFRNVASALSPGAPFLFDLTMEEGYRARWKGEYSFVTADEACRVQPSFDPGANVAHNRFTLDRRTANGWRRTEFDIVQVCHSAKELEDALRRAGLALVRSYDAESDLGIRGERGRSFFLARCKGDAFSSKTGLS